LEYGQNYPTFFIEFKKMAAQLKMVAKTSFFLKPIELTFFKNARDKNEKSEKENNT
jgi:hypothetical protein